MTLQDQKLESEIEEIKERTRRMNNESRALVEKLNAETKYIIKNIARDFKED